MAAQRLGAKASEKRRDLEQLRAINAAITTAGSTLNLFGSLKKQYVAALAADHEARTSELKEWQAKSSGQPFEFSADLKILSPLRPPIPALEKLLYDKIDASHSILALFGFLTQSIDNLDWAMRERNAIIEQLQASPSKSHTERAQIHFGLASSEGHSDSRYPDCILAMSRYTNDSIVFSYAIAKQMVRDGEALRLKIGKEAPSLVQPDFERIESLKIIPDLDEYQAIFASLQVEI